MTWHRDLLLGRLGRGRKPVLVRAKGDRGMIREGGQRICAL